MTFQLAVHRFRFRAMESVYFPPDKAGNVLRGALGGLNAAAPARRVDPGRLAEPPRPFVLRASHLNGSRIAPGEMFSFDVHLFDLRSGLPALFEQAFSALAETGLGPRRGRVELLRPVVSTPVALDLSAARDVPERITVCFRTPTELKGSPAPSEAPFGVLFARIGERVSALRSLYGEGPLPLVFEALARRACLVRTVRSDLRYRDVSRRSSRTGAVHGIGGFTGTVEYEGDLAEFVPLLRAARWTGVGRHTVWGNGEIEITGA